MANHTTKKGAVTFRARVLQAGKSATGIEVPPELVAKLGPSRRPAVRATLNGYTYRSSVASRRGRFMLPVSASVRKEAKVIGGDEVEVTLELDTQPREVTTPPDFRAALRRDSKAEAAYEALSYSNKQRFVLSIEGAKTEETRRRRIAKSIEQLGGAQS